MVISLRSPDERIDDTRATSSTKSGMRRRRRFLQLGVAGSALLALGGVGLSLWPGDERQRGPRRPLNAIAYARFPILVAVAARVVRAPGADPVEIAHRVDELVLQGPPE